MICPDCQQLITIRGVLNQMGDTPEFHEIVRCTHCFSELMIDVTVKVTSMTKPKKRAMGGTTDPDDINTSGRNMDRYGSLE